MDSQVLGFVLNEFSILLAPFCPFISEMIFKETSKNESVHLEVITPYNLVDDDLLSKMDILRNIATEALNIRQELNFKVRQPLQSLILKQDNNFSEDLINLIKEEINVKDVVINQDASTDISYDTNLSQELISEGKIREITRLINGARQKSNCTPDDFINISFIDISDSLKEFIQQNTDEIKETSKVSQIVFEGIDSDYEAKGKIDDDKFTLQLKKEN
ncbi:MAG: class I tRNA ligase family protein [Candidatus Pacebacteria bacterium]|nr:class I tRNA ligase family protein [Candidatus Paceibacterota bacterium]